MKFTKEEISLCKQLAKRYKKEIEYGDWYYYKPYLGDKVLCYASKGSYLSEDEIKNGNIIPLWTISDCLEFMETRKSWRVSFLSTSKNINTSTNGESLVCFNYWDEQEKVIVKRGKTPLEACLKAVLAVLEEEK